MKSQNYEPFRSRGLLHSEVAALSVPQPGRVMCDIVLRWAMIIGGWVALHVSGSPFWMIPFVSVWTGVNYYALFIVGHDGMHRRHSASVEVNDLINDVFVLASMFALTRRNRTNHMLHHALLALPADPDRYKYDRPATRSRLVFLAELTGLTMLVNVVRNVFFRKTPVSSGQPKLGWSLRDCAILLLVNALLVAGLSAAFGWWGYLAVWLIPVYVFVYCADLLRTFLEHATLSSEMGAKNRLVSFEAPWWERQVFAPMSMNFHAAHHLYPSIPYFNLVRANALIRNRLSGSDEPIVRQSYLRHLYALWRDLDDSRQAGIPVRHEERA